MSWQEDLQQLDTALAGGQISADDYRRRRDEVLAKASGGTSGQSAQVPPAQPMGQPQSQPMAQPMGQSMGQPYPGQPPTPPPGMPQAPQPSQQAPQPSQGYFPPPFRWQTTPPQQQQPTNSAEETQTMRPVGQSDAEQTQVVPGSPAGQGGDRTQVVQGRPGDRTQVVGPNSGGFSAQYYTQQPDGPGWQGQDSTPWGGPEFPPLGATGNWGLKQGPEIFETGGGGKSRRIIAIVAAVVVLALIGGGIWWFTTGNKPSANATTTTTTTTHRPPTTTKPAGPKEPLAGLAGHLDPQSSGPTSVQQSQQKSQFSPSEATLMADCGATTGLTQTLFQDTWFTQVHVFTCSSASAAQTAAGSLLTKQSGFGFQQITGAQNLPTMLLDHATDVPNAPVDERTFYATGKTLIRIEVRGHDQATAKQGMDEVVTAVMSNYPLK